MIPRLSDGSSARFSDAPDVIPASPRRGLATPPEPSVSRDGDTPAEPVAGTARGDAWRGGAGSEPPPELVSLEEAPPLEAPPDDEPPPDCAIASVVKARAVRAANENVRRLRMDDLRK